MTTEDAIAATGPSWTAPATRTRAAAEARKPRVLVVEDEDALRRVAVRALERGGYVVLEAPDGAEALTHLMACGPRIDLVVADLCMPGLDGLELQRLAGRAGLRSRFLFTSGCTEDELQERASPDRPVAFLAKPWTPAELVERIEAMLGDGGGP